MPPAVALQSGFLEFLETRCSGELFVKKRKSSKTPRIIVSYRRHSPLLSAGDFGQRVHHVRGRRLKRGHAQAVDQPVALETASRIPQYVAERIFQYKLVAQPFDVLPVNRIRRARRAVIDLHV